MMKQGRKGLCLLLSLIILLSGCAGIPETEVSPEQTSEKSTKQTAAGTAAPAETETKTVRAYLDGIIGAGKKAEASPGKHAEAAVDGAYYYEEAMAPAEEECPPYPGHLPGPEPKAGLLTAREWSDVKNIPEFLKYLEEQKVQSVLAARQMPAGNVLFVQGLQGLNQLILKTSDGEILAEAAANVYGKAVLFFDGKAAGNKALTLLIDGQENEVTLNGRFTELSFDAHPEDLIADKLDLMLMVDTTGSMADELEYLKKELTNVVESVYARNPDMSIRVSVNFYRDEGDEYVVKYYDFRDEVQAAVELIEAQSAFGGGDYPEAVHTALDNAVFGHTWREDAVKLCYLVFDAPPHREGSYVDVDEQTRKRVENIDATLQKAVSGAAAAGIRIIPVVASGAEDEVETLGRCWAFSTGGTYIYLTNDSGIGYWHETPDVPETQLEYLNDCLIRVTAEYCGLLYEAGKYPEPSSGDEQTPPPVYELPVEPIIRETE